MGVGHRQGLLDAYRRPLEPGDEVVLRDPVVGNFIVQAIERVRFDENGQAFPQPVIRVHLRAQLTVAVPAFHPTGLVRTRTKAELIQAGVIREEQTPGEAVEEAEDPTPPPPGEGPAPRPSLVLTDRERQP